MNVSSRRVKYKGFGNLVTVDGGWFVVHGEDVDALPKKSETLAR
jgi:hypothetical protein